MTSRVSALFTAAARGNLSAVRLVLEHGDAGGAPDKLVDARTADARGDTALHVAAAHLRWPVVSWLAANGADPDARNVAGHTALDVIPTSEGKDVYVAILARAPSPRANRVARRIAASPTRFRGDDENLSGIFDANVVRREAGETGTATAKPAFVKPASETGERARTGRVEPFRNDAHASRDERGISGRTRHLGTNEPAPVSTLEETLRADIATARDEIRAMSPNVSESRPDTVRTRTRTNDETRSARTPTRDGATTGATTPAETPATTRRVLRRLDRGGDALSEDDASSFPEDAFPSSSSSSVTSPSITASSWP